MYTSILRPNLASHAPNVNIMILSVGIVISDMYKTVGTNNTSVNIIPSRHRSAIRRCLC
jgi:hypothetical protein